MVGFGYVQTMARYGAWQNNSLMLAADGLEEAARQKDRGGFFGSIAGTLNHLLWGDRIWMARFAGTDDAHQPSIAQSVSEAQNWSDYCGARTAMDSAILTWAGDVNPAWFDGDLTWFSGAAQRDVSKPKTMLVMHFFNHATHHRGQVHAMLTAAGARPDDTDLFLMPEA